MRRVDDVAANSIGFWMGDERADKPWDSLLMHVDHIVVDLDEDCVRIEVFKVGPELRPRSFEVVDLDVGRGSVDEIVEPDCRPSAKCSDQQHAGELPRSSLCSVFAMK